MLIWLDKSPSYLDILRYIAQKIVLPWMKSIMVSTKNYTIIILEKLFLMGTQGNSISLYFMAML
jgi:hypothetical protein